MPEMKDALEALHNQRLFICDEDVDEFADYAAPYIERAFLKVWNAHVRHEDEAEASALFVAALKEERTAELYETLVSNQRKHITALKEALHDAAVTLALLTTHHNKHTNACWVSGPAAAVRAIEKLQPTIEAFLSPTEEPQ